MSFMATLIGLLRHWAVSWLLSNQTFANTLTFPRKESKAAGPAAMETKLSDVTYPVTASVDDSALTH